jgi:hypothetical protein
MARPKGFAKPRAVHLSVRLTEKERAALGRLAAEASMRPSEWVRVQISGSLDDDDREVAGRPARSAAG